MSWTAYSKIHVTLLDSKAYKVQQIINTFIISYIIDLGSIPACPKKSGT